MTTPEHTPPAPFKTDTRHPRFVDARYRASYLVQTALWLAGVWHHSHYNDECTPDFGCCTEACRISSLRERVRILGAFMRNDPGAQAHMLGTLIAKAGGALQTTVVAQWCCDAAQVFASNDPRHCRHTETTKLASPTDPSVPPKGWVRGTARMPHGSAKLIFCSVGCRDTTLRRIAEAYNAFVSPQPIDA